MARWKGGHCPKCGRPIAQKAGAPVEPCPDCTITSHPPAGPRDASLARLKAQWQAEALDEVADMAERTVLNVHPNVLRQWANRKRRQAEDRGGER